MKKKINRALLVLNGRLPKNVLYDSYDYVVCADGAFDLVRQLTKVDIVVGDMDSICNIPNINCIKLDKDKDYTDGQIALEHIVGLGCDKVDIIGIDGGRLDHILYNLSLCMYGSFVTLLGDNFFAKALFRGVNHIGVTVGDTVSLVPFFGQVHINSTKGLKFALENYKLDFGTISTISNIALQKTITIDIQDGLLMFFCNTMQSPKE